MKPTLNLTPAPPKTTVSGTKATFHLSFQGFAEGDRVELSFVEKVGTDESGNRSERVLGTAAGKIAPLAGASTVPTFSFVPDEPPPPPPKAAAGQPPPVTVGFRVPATKGANGASSPESIYVLPIDGDRVDVDEGEFWEIEARCENHNLVSVAYAIARIRRQLGANQATYDWHGGNTAAFFSNGSTDEAGSGGAFHEILKAIGQAEHFVFIADWSFHPMFRPGRGTSLSNTIGSVLNNVAAKALVAIHVWDHTSGMGFAAPDDQNDDGDIYLDKIAGSKRPAKLLWRASSHDQTGCSHHQKYVLVDCPGPNGRRDLKAFFGGLDLTQGRFDWPVHPIMPDQRDATGFLQSLSLKKETFDDWYNAEFGGNRDLPRQPWHDIHGMVQGPAAWDLVREFVGRWNVDPAYPDAQGNDGDDDMKAVLDVFKALFDKDKFVQQWEPHPGPWAAQVVRSMYATHWGPHGDVVTPARKGTKKEFEWTIANKTSERSIQDAYNQAIDQAEKFIYIETQYFIGSGKRWGRDSIANDLPGRITDRIIARMKDKLPFHAYVVMPMFPEGNPVGVAAVAQRQFEWNTMQYMATTLFKVASPLGLDWRDYLSFMFLAKWETIATPTTKGSRADRVKANRRYMVYVHSKLMIVDDRYILFGSANLNERSLAGDRDLEIGCALWPGLGKEAACIEQLKQFRGSLWRELFGGPVAAGTAPESAACVKEIRARGLANYVALRELKALPQQGLACLFPFVADRSGFYVDSLSRPPEGDSFLPDSVYNEGSMGSKLEWLWHSPGAHIAGGAAE